MQIDLTHEESDALALLLHERCRELRFEIAHTDHREYKRSLVHRLEMMEGILTRLTPTTKGTPVMEVA